MTPDNLATVICPNLLRAPRNDFGLIMKNMGSIIVLFKALITHVCIFVFNDVQMLMKLTNRSISSSAKTKLKRRKRSLKMRMGI